MAMGDPLLAGKGGLGWFNADDYGGGHETQTGITGAITAAQNAGGGVVYIPAGVWPVTSTITVTGAVVGGNTGFITLRGDGPRLSILRRTTNYGHTVNFQPTTSIALRSCAVEDLGFYYEGAANMTTTDAHLSAYHWVEGRMNNLLFYNGGIGIEMWGKAYDNFISNIKITVDASHTGEAGMVFTRGTYLLGDYVCTATISNCDIFPSGMVLTHCILIQECDGLWFNNVHMGRATTACVYIAPGVADSMIAGIKFENCWFDNSLYAQLYGVIIGGTTTGGYGTFNFSHCMFQGSGLADRGFYVASGCNAREIIVNDCIFYNYWYQAVYLLGGNKIDIRNNRVSQCSMAANNTHSGITVDGVTYFNITNNSSGLTFLGTAVSRQKYGIQIAGASDYYMIVGNSCYGNVTGGVSDGGSGGNKLVTNNVP